MRFIIPFLALLVVGQPPAEAPLIRLNVDLVQVDAVVTDAKGRRVPGLGPEDFEIRQDGKRQKITGVNYIAAPLRAPARTVAGSPVTPPAAANRMERAGVRRTIALVVDDLALSFENAPLVQQALRDYIDKRMEPGDLVAIVRTSAGVGVLQQFTADKRILHVAANQVKFQFWNRTGVSSFDPIRDNRSALETATRNPDAVPPSIGAPEISKDADANGRSINPFPREGPEPTYRRNYFSAGTLGALRYLMEGLRGLPGRKSVILFSEDLRIQNADNSETWLLPHLQAMVETANRSGVVLYTVDPRGSVFDGFQAADEIYDDPKTNAPSKLMEKRDQRGRQYFQSQAGLSYMAAQTGGLFLYGANSLSGLVQRAVEDQAGYYLISYRPEEGTFDGDLARRKYHRVQVHVRRRGAKVRSRDGFFGLSESETESQRTSAQQIMAALWSPFQGQGVGVQLTTMFDMTGAQGPAVLSLLHIEAKNLHFVEQADGWRAARLEIVTMSSGESSADNDIRRGVYTVRLRGADYENALRRGFLYQTTHPVRSAGGFQFRVVVRDADAGQLGSASRFIEIPDVGNGRLALSGIMLHDAASAGGRDEEATAVTEGHPAVRRFRQGQQVSYEYKVLNAVPGAAARVRLFRGKEMVFESPVKPLTGAISPDGKRMMAGGGLRLVNAFAPGEYFMQVVVTGGKSAEAEQWIDFEVLPEATSPDRR